MLSISTVVHSSKYSEVNIPNRVITAARKVYGDRRSRMEALEHGMAVYRRYEVSNRMTGRNSIWGGRKKVNTEGEGTANSTKVT